MNRFAAFIFAMLASIALAAPAAAQTCPAFSTGQVLTAGQWQACFDAKQPALGYVPVNKAGDTMAGKFTTATPGTAGTGFNIPPGAAPTSPNDGDIWVTTAGVFARINGVTIGPVVASSGAATSLGTVSTGTTSLNCAVPLQTMLNGGASTIALPTSDGQCVLQVINGNGAGSITLTGNSATPSTGDSFSTTLTKSATVTITNATPGVITWTTHGLLANAMVFFSTTGTLPLPFLPNTIYYVVGGATLLTNTFQLSLTAGGAAINTTTAGSGTHTGKQPSVFALQNFTIAGLATAVWKKQQ